VKRYELAEAGHFTFVSVVDAFLARGPERWHNEAGAGRWRCDTDA
jgi:hypothetical protein